MKFFTVVWVSLVVTSSIELISPILPTPAAIAPVPPAFSGDASHQTRLLWHVDSRWSLNWILNGSLMGALIVTAVALAIGVYQYSQNQKWHRIEFLRKTVKEFEQEPNIWRALKILDFEEYRDYEVILGNKQVVFQVTNELLCAALASHKERIIRKQEIDALKATGCLTEEELERYQIETTLRDWFNQLLNGLEHFGYFVESGLFTVNEIRPWMIYWIRLIADRHYKRPGASKFYDQLYNYIHEYGFAGVIQLFERFGYRILPTPYQEDDFKKLDDAFQKRQAAHSMHLSFGAIVGMYPCSRSIDRHLIQMALSLAKAAYLIYQDETYVDEITHQRWRIGTDSSQYFDEAKRDTQAFLFRTDSCIVLAFRGSQERKDWHTNFKFKLKNFACHQSMEPLDEDTTPPIGMVHSGFQAAWNTIETPIIQQIRLWNADRSAPLPLFITGHSLGGALATVAAASLVKRKHLNIQGVYTFGQPRVGDLVFVFDVGQALKGKVFRFVNNNDIVPHVPLPYSFWNPLRIYAHLGQLLYFNTRGQLILQPNAIVWLVDRAIGLLRDVLEPGFDMVNDHRLEFYITNLEKALAATQEQE
ncbi:lipase family protein [Thermocoleostomius sinensis]|uniref:Lipase family protein n=1 Tax=Thermocoleostomius sinensis A174 TaxID=2016057 RepID=A0A9E8ZG12_9CYAN|nr:lipase family protein [Thermocoleostomius sinensis]WAL62136.1 lipase family protein [Thermocoleostomius sinensis A174]